VAGGLTGVKVKINNAAITRLHGPGYPIGFFMDRVRGSLDRNAHIDVPKRTGNMARSIETRHVLVNQHASKVTLSVNVGYAVFVHYGTAPMRAQMRLYARAGANDARPGRSRQRDAVVSGYGRFYLARTGWRRGQAANQWVLISKGETMAVYARYIG